MAESGTPEAPRETLSGENAGDWLAGNRTSTTNTPLGGIPEAILSAEIVRAQMELHETVTTDDRGEAALLDYAIELGRSHEALRAEVERLKPDPAAVYVDDAIEYWRRQAVDANDANAELANGVRLLRAEVERLTAERDTAITRRDVEIANQIEHRRHLDEMRDRVAALTEALRPLAAASHMTASVSCVRRDAVERARAVLGGTDTPKWTGRDLATFDIDWDAGGTDTP